MQLPRITIITVVYNGVLSLKATIDSVNNLSYPYVDYIIIDGGSTDGTVDIIKQREHLLKYWVSKKDKGIYDAMNKGWANVEDNSYILYLGSGDKVLRLPNMAMHINHPIVYGRVQVGAKYVFNATIDFRMKMINALHHQALLVHKSVHPDPPFSLNYPVFADFDFNQRLYKQGLPFVKDETFLGYAMEGGVSSNFNKRELYSIIRKNYGSIYVAIAKTYYMLVHIKNKITGFQH